jgi:restriction endonuclease Mrr
MLPKIINLTLHLVIKEIENVLEDCPEHSYQVVFSIQEWQHKLILCVLNQIPNYYTIIEDIQHLPEDPTSLYRSPEEKANLKTLIYESMACILQENSESLSGDILQETNSNF